MDRRTRTKRKEEGNERCRGGVESHSVGLDVESLVGVVDSAIMYVEIIVIISLLYSCMGISLISMPFQRLTYPT